VYIIQSGGATNMPIKIGMSDNPDKRIKQLQTGNPELLRIIAIIECKSREHASLVEKTFHREMTDKNILNEWFSPKKGAALKAILNMVDDTGGSPVKQVGEGLANRVNTPKERAANRKLEKKSKMVKQMEAKASKMKAKVKIMKNMLIEFGVDPREIDKL